MVRATSCGAPKTVHRHPAGGIECDTLLHAVGDDSVERTQHSVKESGYPHMPLRETQSLGIESASLEMLVSMAVVSENGSVAWRVWHLLEAQAVLGGYCAATLERGSHLGYVEVRHLIGDAPGGVVKSWL